MTNTAQVTISPPADPTARVITWTQRLLLHGILQREADRLLSKAEQLDQQLSEDEAAVEVADDLPHYDERCEAVDHAHTDAAAVEDLLGALEQAKLLTTSPAPDRDPVTTIANALVAAHVQGRDVGEVLALAVADAQRTVFLGSEDWLTSNRPGSWEAALLSNIVEASGWDH